MKKNILFSFLVFFSLSNVIAGGYDDSYKTSLFIPDHFSAQFAGNIGFLSGGFGYSLRNGKINSDILLGYVPSQIGKKTIVTISQKNTLNLNSFRQTPFNRFYPSFGFSINLETGRNSFLVLPDSYPDDYYASNAVTFGLFTGINYKGNYKPESRFSQIEYFAEVGTLASYIYFNIKRKEYFNPDILSLALGVRLNISNLSSI